MGRAGKFSGMRERHTMLGAAIGCLVAAAPHPARAQQPDSAGISIGDAVGLALARSEAVTIARVGISRARGQVLEAESGWWPQLSGNASYVRTIQTQYSSLINSPLFGGSPTGSGGRNVALCSVQLDSNATTAERASALAQAQSCASGSGFGNTFASVGFGSPNAYTLGLNFSQTLFSGQVLAASQAATAPRRSAEIELAAQQAQVVYDAAQAYYDAALSDALLTIADSTLAQSERTLAQARLERHVGTQSDFDLLQAQVTRDNEVPIVLQRRNDRDLAYFRLKQLLKLSLDAPVRLTTGVRDPLALPGDIHLSALTDSADAGDSAALPVGDTTVERRSSVREQQLTVTEYLALRHEAQYEYLPSFTLASSYTRVAYPVSGLPAWNSFLPNWTISIGASVPIFNGFRTHGDVMVAHANLAEQRARLDQERELAALDARTTVANFRVAEANWAATAGSVTQALRAYQIAELRYREGLSTLIELNDSRLAKQQALANRAQAARNLQVARVRLALLRDLPVSATAGSAGASAAQSAAQGGGAAGTTPQTAATTAATMVSPGPTPVPTTGPQPTAQPAQQPAYPTP
jgi:outer membrane protein TolC